MKRFSARKYITNKNTRTRSDMCQENRVHIRECDCVRVFLFVLFYYSDCRA